MKINWNFLGGGGVQNKKPSMGGVWIFSGTAHFAPLVTWPGTHFSKDPITYWALKAIFNDLYLKKKAVYGY